MARMTRTSRREFAKTLTAAGAAIAAGELVAQTPPMPAPVQGPPPPSPLGKALKEVVRAQSGPYLSDDELERIGTDLQELMPLVERLRQFPLVNSDEPDVTFSALTRRW
jgi:hypothetical protein